MDKLTPEMRAKLDDLLAPLANPDYNRVYKDIANRPYRFLRDPRRKRDYRPTPEEVDSMANYLDIEPESGLMWLAKEAACAPLPKVWRKMEMIESGDVYYVNPDTKKTSRENPMDQYYLLRVADERENLELGCVSRDSPTPSRGTPRCKFRESQRTYTHPNDGSRYFVSTPQETLEETAERERVAIPGVSSGEGLTHSVFRDDDLPLIPKGWKHLTLVKTWKRSELMLDDKGTLMEPVPGEEPEKSADEKKKKGNKKNKKQEEAEVTTETEALFQGDEPWMPQLIPNTEQGDMEFAFIDEFTAYWDLDGSGEVSKSERAAGQKEFAEHVKKVKRGELPEVKSSIDFLESFKQELIYRRGFEYQTEKSGENRIRIVKKIDRHYRNEAALLVLLLIIAVGFWIWKRFFKTRRVSYYVPGLKLTPSLYHQVTDAMDAMPCSEKTLPTPKQSVQRRFYPGQANWTCGIFEFHRALHSEFPGNVFSLEIITQEAAKLSESQQRSGATAMTSSSKGKRSSAKKSTSIKGPRCAECDGGDLDQKDPSSCICGVAFCSDACHETSWPTHKVHCQRLWEEHSVAFTLTHFYWVLVLMGALPFKNETDFVSQWKQTQAAHTAAAKNSDQDIERELQYYLATENRVWRNEISKVQDAAKIVWSGLDTDYKHTTVKMSENEQARALHAYYSVGKKQKHRALTPLESDSIARLTFKHTMCGVYTKWVDWGIPDMTMPNQRQIDEIYLPRIEKLKEKQKNKNEGAGGVVEAQQQQPEKHGAPSPPSEEKSKTLTQQELSELID